jgi:CRP/FNR family cyclic AMP-dependent transcriptional regulator
VTVRCAPDNPGVTEPNDPSGDQGDSRLKWDIALRGLAEGEIRQIEACMHSRLYGPRRTLFREGEPSDSLIVVKAGRVRLYLSSAEGDEFTVMMVTAGSLLGLAAAVLGKPRILTAESVGSVDAMVMPVADLVHCMRTIPQFAINLTRLLAILAAENIQRAGPLALDSSRVRLGRILVALAAADPRSNGAATVEGLTHDDLGKLVGATRTWVSLTLADFEKRGLISKYPGRIVILEPGVLAAVD